MSPADFYDALEPFYHLVYPDWPASIDRQGAELSELIRDRWGIAASTVLDATCGIGTQALGLASRGYDVTASDVSPRSIARLKYEASSRGLQVNASVCDIQELSAHHARQFDVIMSCDNSLPHLKPEDELPLAIRQMFCCTRVGGGCVITLRDYAKENLTGQQLRPYGIRQVDERNFIVFQTWDCHDTHYEVTLYFVEDDGRTPPICHRMRSTYYPIGTERILELMTAVGFEKVQRLDGVFFQPVLVGERRK
jgi:SAM-dependent methyltransferase